MSDTQIFFLLLGGGIALVVFVLLPLMIDSETAIEDEVKKRLGLVKDGEWLAKPGLRLRFFMKGTGKHSQWTVAYKATLDEGAKGLSLYHEGARSAAEAGKGEEEVLTGDSDFDQLFWVKVAPEGFLTPLRQAWLAYHLADLPEAEITDGVLTGERPCQPGPRGKKDVLALVDHVEKLGPSLLSAEMPVGRPAGWVGKAKRASYARGALLAGLFCVMAVLLRLVLTVPTGADQALANYSNVCMLVTGVLFWLFAATITARRKICIAFARASYGLAFLTQLLLLYEWFPSILILLLFISLTATWAFGSQTLAALSRLELE